MTTKVKKWGNSLAIRLPKKIVDQYNLAENSEINFVARSDLEIKEQIVINIKDKKVGLADWHKYIIPSPPGTPKENISENIDEILYGKYN